MPLLTLLSALRQRVQCCGRSCWRPDLLRREMSSVHNAPGSGCGVARRLGSIALFAFIDVDDEPWRGASGRIEFPAPGPRRMDGQASGATGSAQTPHHSLVFGRSSSTDDTSTSSIRSKEEGKKNDTFNLQKVKGDICPCVTLLYANGIYLSI